MEFTSVIAVTREPSIAITMASFVGVVKIRVITIGTVGTIEMLLLRKKISIRSMMTGSMVRT